MNIRKKQSQRQKNKTEKPHINAETHMFTHIEIP